MRILVGVAVLFVLQLFPFTGIFLMLVAAPLWSVPLINLAIIIAGIEGLTGRAPRWFVLVPVCWFGLYSLAAARDEAALVKARNAVEQANAAAVAIIYDPARDDLVANHFVDDLLLRHRLPVVYSEPRRGRDRATEAARLATGTLCDTLAARKSGAKVTVRQIHAATARHYGLVAGPKHCIVAFAEEPGRDIIRLTHRRAVKTFDGLAVKMTIVRAESGDRHAEVRGAAAAILPSFPLPGIGCALNSGAPSWDCFATFLREPRVQFGTKNDDKRALGLVLDLSRATLGSFDEAANNIVREHLARADQRNNLRRSGEVLAFLADPAGYKHRRQLLRELAKDPDKLAPLTDRTITALEAADAHQRRTGERRSPTAEALAGLVAILPDAEFRNHGARIVAVLDGPTRGWRRRAHALMRRTALLGETALPMLLARLQGPRSYRRIQHPKVDAIIALCRMGLPFAASATPALLEFWHWRNSEERARRLVRRGAREKPLPRSRLLREDRYLYLALMRLGATDAPITADTGKHADWWRKASQTVTAESPADACEAVR